MTVQGNSRRSPPAEERSRTVTGLYSNSPSTQVLKDEDRTDPQREGDGIKRVTIRPASIRIS